jgi:hypothetical protein
MGEIIEFNGFNCSIVPNDWEDYLEQYRAEKDRFAKCFNELLLEKTFEYLGGDNESELPVPINDPCWDEIQSMITLFYSLLGQTTNKMNILIAALAAATPNQPETFDVNVYYDYIETYNEMMDTSKMIIIMLNTRCSVMGVENNVGVDTQTLGTKIVHQCTGVYMKQMDNGSEFIGNISSKPNITSNGSLNY